MEKIEDFSINFYLLGGLTVGELCEFVMINQERMILRRRKLTRGG